MNEISGRIQSDQASQEGEREYEILKSYCESTSVSFLFAVERRLSKALSPLSTDYDLALAVMEASGKLAEFVTKQQKGEVNSSQSDFRDGPSVTRSSK